MNTLCYLESSRRFYELTGNCLPLQDWKDPKHFFALMLSIPTHLLRQEETFLSVIPQSALKAWFGGIEFKLLQGSSRTPTQREFLDPNMRDLKEWQECEETLG